MAEPSRTLCLIMFGLLGPNRIARTDFPNLHHAQFSTNRVGDPCYCCEISAPVTFPYSSDIPAQRLSSAAVYLPCRPVVSPQDSDLVPGRQADTLLKVGRRKRELLWGRKLAGL